MQITFVFPGTTGLKRLVNSSGRMEIYFGRVPLVSGRDKRGGVLNRKCKLIYRSDRARARRVLPRLEGLRRKRAKWPIEGRMGCGLLSTKSSTREPVHRLGIGGIQNCLLFHNCSRLRHVLFFSSQSEIK